MSDDELRAIAERLVTLAWLELEHAITSKSENETNAAFDRAQAAIVKALKLVRDSRGA